MLHAASTPLLAWHEADGRLEGCSGALLPYEPRSRTIRVPLVYSIGELVMKLMSGQFKGGDRMRQDFHTASDHPQRKRTLATRMG